MTRPNRIVTLLACGTALCMGAVLIASPASEADRPSGASVSDESHVAPSLLFTPREQSGLVFRLQSISSNASMSANPSCPCGFSSHRNLSLNGHITNPMGEHAYRVSRVHIDAIDDAEGNSLLGRGNLSVNPQPHGPKPFVAPQQPGQTVYSYFNANMQIQGGMGLRPDRVAGTVEVEIARDTDIVRIDRQPTDKPIEIAPGVDFRLHRFDIDDTGTLQVAFNYRIDRQTPGAFLRFEILDPQGNQLLRVDSVNETVTATSIVGGYSNSIALGNREIGSIRVHVVGEVETVAFAFDQRGLGALGL